MADLATLGGGCFWCLEAVFERLTGGASVVSGYSGGEQLNPSYRLVCAGSSGHAEVVQVVFYPDVIRYRELLEVFFVIHDPTSLNRQGNDVGTQYRSVIFHHSAEQRAIAESLLAEFSAQALWPDPVGTELLPAPRFYPAEDDHQHYLSNNPALLSVCCRAQASQIAQIIRQPVQAGILIPAGPRMLRR